MCKVFIIITKLCHTRPYDIFNAILYTKKLRVINTPAINVNNICVWRRRKATEPTSSDATRVIKHVSMSAISPNIRICIIQRLAFATGIEIRREF